MARRIWYTIYSAGNDTVLAAGDIDACCASLGISKNSMHNIISSTKSGRLKCYTIVREDLDADTYMVYGRQHRGRPRRKKRVVAKIVKR